MCDRCGPYYDPVQHFTQEEQEYWEDQYWAQQKKEHDDALLSDYNDFLRELQIEAFERGETFIDV